MVDLDHWRSLQQDTVQGQWKSLRRNTFRRETRLQRRNLVELHVGELQDDLELVEDVAMHMVVLRSNDHARSRDIAAASPAPRRIARC